MEDPSTEKQIVELYKHRKLFALKNYNYLTRHPELKLKLKNLTILYQNHAVDNAGTNSIADQILTFKKKLKTL